MWKQIDDLLEILSTSYPSIYRHGVETSRFAIMIAIIVPGGRSNLHEIRGAALLHDFGKKAIPQNILNKPGKLENSEWKIMQHHPETGADLISLIPELSFLAEPIRQHHELPDGSGYPKGLNAEQMHPVAKIINLADRFAAMTERRVYRPAIHPGDAAGILSNDCQAFFPDHHHAILSTLVTMSQQVARPLPALAEYTTQRSRFAAQRNVCDFVRAKSAVQ